MSMTQIRRRSLPSSEVPLTADISRKNSPSSDRSLTYLNYTQTHSACSILTYIVVLCLQGVHLGHDEFLIEYLVVHELVFDGVDSLLQPLVDFSLLCDDCLHLLHRFTLVLQLVLVVQDVVL